MHARLITEKAPTEECFEDGIAYSALHRPGWSAGRRSRDRRRWPSFALLMLLCTSALAAQAQGPRQAPWVGTDESGASCAAKGGGWERPMMYLNPGPRDAELYRKVVGAHFKPEIEQLAVPNADGNLNYTLRAIPNHHRALYAMMRLQLQIRDQVQRGAFRFPAIECYFQRAISFAPGDAKVRMLYGMYKHRTDQTEAASKLYKQAFELDSRDPEIAYNLGLSLAELGRFEEALPYARQAYAQGIVFPGLARQLKGKGYDVQR